MEITSKIGGIGKIFVWIVQNCNELDDVSGVYLTPYINTIMTDILSRVV
jgi:hypothetical protein